MATITASLFTALDGVVDPGVGNWHFPYFNEEMGSAVDATHDADVMLFGRDMRKIVASHSALEFRWRNSEQLRGDLVEAVRELKNDPGIRRVALSGSVSVVRQLLDAGLLDELHLFVHPATAGSGLKLFEDRGPARHLRLISAQPFQTGVVHLVYAPDPNPPTGTYEEAKKDLPQE